MSFREPPRDDPEKFMEILVSNFQHNRENLPAKIDGSKFSAADAGQQAAMLNEKLNELLDFLRTGIKSD